MVEVYTGKNERVEVGKKSGTAQETNRWVERRKQIQGMRWYDLLGNYDEIMRRHAVVVGANLGWEVAEFRGEIERRLKIADSPLGKAQMVLDQAQEISEAPTGPTAEMVIELRARGKVWDMFTKGQRPQ